QLALIGSTPANSIFVLSEGLTAARVIAWALHDEPRAARRLPRLVTAAMLQDVGRLLDSSPALARSGRRAMSAAMIEQPHAPLGAAILGTIRGAPAELQMMVAQHHERLDGGGSPRALAARDILPGTAVLAAATRFARLALGLNSDRPPSGVDRGLAGVAQRL